MAHPGRQTGSGLFGGPRCWLSVAILIAFVAPARSGSLQGQATTVTKKDGSVVVGRIGGFIVLKTREKLAEQKNDPNAEHTAGYVLLNGDSISLIDSSGVHRGNTFVILTASQKGKPIVDSDVVKAALGRLKDGGGGPMMAADLPGGGNVFVIGGKSDSCHENGERSGLTRLSPTESMTIYAHADVADCACLRVSHFKCSIDAARHL